MKIEILAIESSCDDTSAAVIRNGKIISNIVSSQVSHSQLGGVVPELASREHDKNIVTVVDLALKKAQIQLSDLSAVAFTQGPGLLGALIVGCSFAKTLAQIQDIPLIAVRHMRSHVLSNLIEDPKPKFPFLCLTVSGGHTQIVLVKSALKMEVLGETLDDAAGEAFDKAGKMMGLSYPAGPQIDRLAQNGRAIYTFTEPNIPELNFSFSGLKTQFKNFLRRNVDQDANFIEENLSDICASLQERICTILMNKLVLASEKTQLSEISLSGGVSANSRLRQLLKETAEERGWNSYYPSIHYCTDNAAMIAMTAHYQYLEEDFAPLDTVPYPRMEI